MSCIPRLYTPRLCLRPLTLADGPRVAELAGDRRIAVTTATVPHPYTVEAAERWIQSHPSAAAEGKGFHFAITLAGTRTPGREGDLAETGYLIGVIGLHLAPDADDRRAELGYWIGVPYWNKGFATEAAHVVLEFGFSRRHLQRIVACHYATNPTSGRVMRKLGMTFEGTLRRHKFKWGEFVDVTTYGILDTEWQSRRRHPRIILAPGEAGISLSASAP